MSFGLALTIAVPSVAALIAVAKWRPKQVRTVGIQVIALLMLVCVAAIVPEFTATLVLVASCCAFLIAYQKQGRLTLAATTVAAVVGVFVILQYPLSWTLAISFLFGWANAAGQLGASGIHQNEPGARDVADLLPAAGFIVLGAGVAESNPEAAILIVFSALACVANDVLASEIGPEMPGRAHLFPRFASVPHGTPGAVSYAGTAIGCIGSLSAGLCAGALLTSFLGGACVITAGVVGALVDTTLSRTRLHSSVKRGRELINFIGCSSAVCVGLVGYLAIGE